jgi:MFS family permease
MNSEPIPAYYDKAGKLAKPTKSARVFFGWWTVLATSLVTIWGTGYYAVGFSALFKPISADLGLGRAATSVGRSLGQFGGGFEAPVVGWLTDKFGAKTLLLFGVALMGLGLVLMLLVNSLWTFYVVWGVVVATGMNISSQVPVEKTISNWFIKKRGRALSLRFIATGLATVMVVPLISWLIIVVDWRWTCAIGGVVLWLGGLPLYWFFIRRERPEYYGLLPDGAKAEASVDQSKMITRGVDYAARFQEFEFTARQAFRTYAFWLLIIGYIGFQMCIAIVFTHAIPLLTDMGFDPIGASAVMSIAVGVNIPIRYVIGHFSDRLKKEHLRFLLGASSLIMAGAIVFFLFNQTMVTVYVFFILFYLGQGTGMILNSLTRSRYFGRKGLASIQGISQLILMPFSMMAPIYAGWVYDSTGSYMGAFKIFAGLLVIGSILTFFARPPRPPAEIGDIRKFF